MPTLRCDNVGLHFEVGGEGPPVLLTHGFGATSAMFADTIRSLVPDYRVVTWDLRGHGASDSPDDPDLYAAELVVSDMIALLDHLDIERAVVGGHSIGGFLTLQFAIAFPERVCALVLESTGPGFRSKAARDAWNSSVVDKYTGALSEHGVDGLALGTDLHGNTHQGALGLIHGARGFLVQKDSRVLNNLSSITAPALVVVGERDVDFAPGSRYMAAKIPDARLVEIPGAGHAPNLSHPELFNRCLRAFLDCASPRDDPRTQLNRTLSRSNHDGV